MRLYDWVRVFLAEDGGAGAGGSGGGDSGGTAAAPSGEAGGADAPADASASPDSSDTLPTEFEVEGEGESSLGDGADDDGVADEPSGPDEAKLARALAAGLTKEDAIALGDNLDVALTAFDRKLLNGVNQQIEEHKAAQAAKAKEAEAAKAAQAPAQTPEVPIPGEVFEAWTEKLAKSLDEGGFNPEVAKALGGPLKELAGHIAQSVEAKFVNQIQRLEAAENSRVQKDLDRRFGAALEKLDAEEFGTGEAGEDSKGKFFEKRAAIWRTVNAIAFGLKQLNHAVPEVEELVERAYGQHYSKNIATKERAKIASKLKARSASVGARPTARSPAPAGNPAATDDAKGVAEVEKLLARLPKS